MADLDPDSLHKLRVVDLREHLSARGLTTTGLKADLIKRLRESIIARHNEEQGESSDWADAPQPASQEMQNFWVQEQERTHREQMIQEPQRFEQQERLHQEEEQQKRWAEEQDRKRMEEEQNRRWAEEQEQQRLWIVEQEQNRITQEEKLWAEEQERKRLEEQQKRLWVEEQKRKHAEEEQQRLWSEEQERKHIEEQEQNRIAQEEKLWAEEQERKRLEEQQKSLWVEEQKRKHAEEERQRLWAEEQERKHIEEEQQRRWAEEQERKRVEDEQQKQWAAEQEKKHIIEVEQKRQWEEEQQRLWAAEQERKRIEEEQQKMWAAEQERKRIENEQKMRAEEQERNCMEEERQRKLSEEQERKRIEEERQRQLAEEQERMRIEEERQRQLAAEHERKRIEEERQRQLAEEQKRIEIEKQKKMAEEQERKRVAKELERKQIEEQERKRFEEQERKRIEEEQERKHREEQQRIFAKEQERRRVEEEQQRMWAEKQEKKRLMEEEQKKQEERKRLWALEQEKKRAEEEELRKAEEERLWNKEKELFQVQQQALMEIDDEKHAHTSLPMAPPGSLPFPSGLSMPPPSGNLSHIPLHQPPPTMGLPPPPPPPGAALLAPPRPMHMALPTAIINGQFNQPPPPVDMSTSNDILNISPNNLQDSDISVPGIDINTDKDETIKLPQAVEKVFALKSERAQQLGVDPDSVITPAIEKEVSLKSSNVQWVIVDEIEDNEDAEDDDKSKKTKDSKNRRRKKKKKSKKLMKSNTHEPTITKAEPLKTEAIDIDIEYVQDVMDPSDPMYSQFIGIFEKFKLIDPVNDKDNALADAAKDAQVDTSKATDKKKTPGFGDDDEFDDDDDDDKDEKKDDDKPKLSKRKMKKLSRMTVAELKQKVGRPELVEMHDVTARDPVLLLHLKSSRNTVPVPRHWCFKRKYLQGKRGIEKPAFELPDFIKRTGIMEMRQALQEKEDQKTMKAKMRERVRPKLGKIDIDYQKLHDAFFKWQTKPKMTIHGDLYYEGKEFETRLKEKKPGDLSDDLRVALGMPTGPNANKCPPPWLIAMQRYGPPPSYPNLKIPGLNAPIPETCSFGYHAGGWGKPPVDEMGRPLYGDVFGIQISDNMPQIPEEEIDRTLWGELESESSEEEEDEEEEDEDEEETKAEDETGLVTPAEGLITPSGFSSIPAGMETPDMIELRKRKTEAEMEGGDTPALYTILPEKKSDRVGAAMMGSTHIYDLAAAIPASKVKPGGTTSVTPQGIEVALDPSELEMDTAAMAARYEQTMREQQSQLEKEDLSDMVAEHAARQKTKRKKAQQDSGKAPKKYKEFKF